MKLFTDPLMTRTTTLWLLIMPVSFSVKGTSCPINVWKDIQGCSRSTNSTSGAMGGELNSSGIGSTSSVGGLSASTTKPRNKVGLHLWSGTNLVSKLKQRPFSLFAAISAGESLLIGSGAGGVILARSSRGYNGWLKPKRPALHLSSTNLANPIASWRIRLHHIDFLLNLISDTGEKTV